MIRRLSEGLLPVLLLAAFPAAAAPLPPVSPLPRVASATLCADQLVLRLADPQQIASLSPQAHDPTLSLMIGAARTFPARTAGAEAYLADGVELMITDAWTGQSTAALLERLGVRVLRLPLTNHQDGVESMIRAAAAALGHPQRGEDLIDEVRARLAAVQASAAGAGRNALYLRPDGGTAADGTFVGWIMDLNGLNNQARRYGLTGWAGVPAEALVLDPPDLMIHSFFDRTAFSLRGNRGRSGAYTPAVPVITVPGAQWVCGNWGLAVAAETLSQALGALPPSGAPQ